MDKDWADAINEEYGTTVTIDEEAEEEEIDTPDTPDEETEEEETQEEETQEEEEAEGEEAEEAEEEEEKAEEEVDPEEPEEKFAPKDAIKEALREMYVEDKTRNSEHEHMKQEVINALYPEGINRQLLDSEGDPITGIDDLTKLINPKTDDYFTEDEAGAWLLSEQQKLNRNIEQLEDYAADIVETNTSLKEASERVEQVWGDLLESMPEVADRVLEGYKKTMVVDPKTGIVIKAPVDITEYYDVALSGYRQMAEKLSTQKAGEAAAAAEAEKLAKAKEADAQKRDRSDLSPRGQGKPALDEEAQGWQDALEGYFNN